MKNKKNVCFLMLIFCTISIVGCNNNTSILDSNNLYTEIPNGDVNFEYVSNISDNQIIKNFVNKHKEKEGNYVINDGKDTYILLTLGCQSNYGNGLSNLKIYKDSESIYVCAKKYKIISNKVLEKENVPYVLIKINGIIKEEDIIFDIK